MHKCGNNRGMNQALLCSWRLCSATLRGSRVLRLAGLFGCTRFAIRASLRSGPALHCEVLLRSRSSHYVIVVALATMLLAHALPAQAMPDRRSIQQ
jgi:hypothetical protein